MRIINKGKNTVQIFVLYFSPSKAAETAHLISFTQQQFEVFVFFPRF